MLSEYLLDDKMGDFVNNSGDIKSSFRMRHGNSEVIRFFEACIGLVVRQFEVGLVGVAGTLLSAVVLSHDE